MDYRSYQNRLEYLLELIEKKRLGPIEAVARRFGVSTRTVKRMISYLREQGHQIEYDRLQKKYFLKISK